MSGPGPGEICTSPERVVPGSTGGGKLSLAVPFILDLERNDVQDQPPSWTSRTVPVEQVADPFAKDLAWIGAGAAADLMSTSAALRWCQNCREGNGLGWDVEARVSLKLSLAVGAGSGCWWLRRSGHGKTATVIRWTLFSVQMLATANNAVHAIKGR